MTTFRPATLRELKELGADIGSQRLQGGFSQAELAHHCGVATQTVEDVERGSPYATWGSYVALRSWLAEKSAAATPADLIQDNF